MTFNECHSKLRKHINKVLDDINAMQDYCVFLEDSLSEETENSDCLVEFLGMIVDNASIVIDESGKTTIRFADITQGMEGFEELKEYVVFYLTQKEREGQE